MGSPHNMKKDSPLNPLSLINLDVVPQMKIDNGASLMDDVDAVVQCRTSRPLAIYVSVPFCGYKCHFCDWVADVPAATLRSDEQGRSTYVDAMVRQIRTYGPRLSAMGYEGKYMYWGGGTPTRLGVSELKAVGTALRDSMDLTSIEQWTVESSPNDITGEKLDLLLSLGVNRISLGVQSLDKAELRKNGRSHSPEQALAAIELLKSSGIPSFSVDIMTGLPNRDTNSDERTLDHLIELGVPHFSVYPYRSNPDTVLGKQLKKGSRQPEELEAQLRAYQQAAEKLQHAGYGRGQHHGAWRTHERHEDKDGNYKYALRGDKFGFGSGAESVIGHRVVWNPHANMKDFIRNPLRFSYVEKFDIKNPELFRNYIAGALLTFDEGLIFERFLDFTGVDFATLKDSTWVQLLFQYIESCGGRLLWTDESLTLESDCIDEVVVVHQSRVAQELFPATIEENA